MWASIEIGAEFYFDEDDYLSEPSRAMRQAAKNSIVKVEPASLLGPGAGTSVRGTKRPRRSAAVAVLSYAVPSSDDENLNGEEHRQMRYDTKNKVRQETKLQLWIKHLSLLLKSETKKVSCSAPVARISSNLMGIAHGTEKTIGAGWTESPAAKSLFLLENLEVQTNADIFILHRITSSRLSWPISGYCENWILKIAQKITSRMSLKNTLRMKTTTNSSCDEPSDAGLFTRKHRVFLKFHLRMEILSIYIRL